MIYIKLYIICYTITDVISAVSTMGAYGGLRSMGKLHSHNVWANAENKSIYTYGIEVLYEDIRTSLLLYNFRVVAAKLFAGWSPACGLLWNGNAITTEQKRPPDTVGVVIDRYALIRYGPIWYTDNFGESWWRLKKMFFNERFLFQRFVFFFYACARVTTLSNIMFLFYFLYNKMDGRFVCEFFLYMVTCVT